MRVYVLAWMFAQLMNSPRHNATVLSLVHLQPLGDSPRSVEVSRHRLSLSSLPALLQTFTLTAFGQIEKASTRHVRHERRWGRLNQMFVHYGKNNMLAFAPSHSSWIHSSGISCVYLKTNRLPSYASLPAPDSHLSPPQPLCTLSLRLQWLIQLNKTRPSGVVPLCAKHVMRRFNGQ